MYPVFYCDEFDELDLDNGGSPLRKKFDAIIKDLKENEHTSLGDIKLISGDGGVKYFRAKLSDSDRLLFTSIKYNNEDAFVILEVILNHKYDKSKFLTNKEKIKNIKIIDQNNKEVSDSTGEVKIRDAPQVRWLDKFITFSAKQEDIVENAEGLPLIVSGSAGSGKTSVALEKLRKIEEEFKEGKILYITQSESLIKKSKELYEYEYYDGAANKLRTGVSQRIEFLSVHEFIERVTKEDVEGKKPINRNAFFSWFNEKCKKKEFKEYAKDGEKIFEEFIAVIAGKCLGKKEKYEQLGDRQSIFPRDKRSRIYGFFEKYRKFIEEDREYYDPNLIAHRCTEEEIRSNKVYDVVVVDEVQDLTESTLKLILKSLKDESKSNFLLCGDVNQVIYPSFFSLSKLKSFLYQNEYNKEPKVCILEKNYRSSKQVIELANRILHFKNHYFASEDQMTEDEKKAFFMESDTENPGNVGFIAKGDEQEIAEKISESTNWAVLVLDDESKEDACKCFDPSFVFNIHEAKGLEFDNVILYKFTSHKAYSDMWDIARQNEDKEEKVEDTIKKIRDSYDKKDVNTSRPKDKEDRSFEKYKFYIHALYVAVTCTVSNAYIIEGEKQCNLLKVVALGKEVNKVDTKDIKKEKFDPKKWKARALMLIDNGNMEQAKGKVIKLLEKGEKEYAQEIMDALEAKGHRVGAVANTVVQSPSDKARSVEGIRRKVKKQLEVEKELIAAIKDGHTETAKKLIDEDVNAKDLKEQTPLRLEGKERVTKLKKEGKAFDKTIRGLKDEAVDNLMKSMKPGEFMSFKDDVIKGIYVEYCVLELFAMAIMSVFEPKVKERHTAFNNKNGRSLPGEEITNELTAIVAGKRRLMQCKKIRDGAKNLVEGVFVNILELPDKKQVSRDKKYRLQLLQEKFKNPIRSIEENIMKQLKELVDDYSEEELDSRLDEICQALENNVAKLKKYINQEEQKIKQEEVKASLLSLFPSKERVDLVARSQECLSERAPLKIHFNKLVHKLEDCRKKVENLSQEQLSYSEFEKLRDEAIDITGRFEKLLQTYGHIFKQSAKNRRKIGQKFDVVDLLLLPGIGVDARDEEGFTFLHVAAENGLKNIVDSFLQCGADVNDMSKKGITPLHLAAKNGHKDVVDLLLKREANVTASGSVTPLHVAAYHGHEEVVKALLNKGADINSKDNDGKIPLELAKNHPIVENILNLTKQLFDHIKENQVEKIRSCMNKGAIVNATSKGKTPLHFAAEGGNKDIAGLLLDKDANVNAKTEEGFTSLALALEFGYSKIVDLLLADPNINVGYIQIGSLENGKNKEKIRQKFAQDANLFQKVKKSAEEKDENKVDALLKEIEELLESKTEYGFKPSLNYSPDGKDENTTIEIAIKAGGKILRLLKEQQENPQPKSSFNDVSTPHNLAQAQASIT